MLQTLYFIEDNINTSEKKKKNNKDFKNKKKIESKLKDLFYYFISELENEDNESSIAEKNDK